MASCVRNICIKKYYNLVFAVQVTTDNVRVLFEIQCTCSEWNNCITLLHDTNDLLTTKQQTICFLMR